MIQRSVEEQKKEWEERYVRPLLERTGERHGTFRTDSGIPLERVYTPAGQDL